MGEGSDALIFRQPYLSRVSLSPSRGDGDGRNVSCYVWAFVLWRLSLAVSVALLRVRAAVTES